MANSDLIALYHTGAVGTISAHTLNPLMTMELGFYISTLYFIAFFLSILILFVVLLGIITLTNLS